MVNYDFARLPASEGYLNDKRKEQNYLRKEIKNQKSAAKCLQRSETSGQQKTVQGSLRQLRVAFKGILKHFRGYSNLPNFL